MKNRFCRILLVGLMFDLNISFADTEIVNGVMWTYTVSNGKASIGVGKDRSASALPTSTSGPITIPTILGGKPVTHISKYAFYNCNKLTSVTIPDFVTSIDICAFEACTNLVSIVIPNSVTMIGGSAFSQCERLISVTIPDSVMSIGSHAFSQCKGLTSVSLGNSVAQIGSGVFYGCNKLKSVNIPDSVTSIGTSAFYNCKSLASVTIGNGVTSICGECFSGCDSLRSVAIPNSVTSIESSAFNGCSQLYDTTTIPGVRLVDGWAVGSETSLSGNLDLTGIRGIGNNTFMNRTFESVIIPDSVTSIGEGAFVDCYISSVLIPNSVTNIGFGAFAGCSGLMSITIPNSMKNIGCGAFYKCYGLKSVTIPNSVTNIGESAFYNCGSLSSMNIPDSVTSIGDQAFYACNSLKSVTIPPSVLRIGISAFSSCGNLQSVTIPVSVTTIGASAFGNCNFLKAVHISDLAAWCRIRFDNDGANPLFCAKHLFLNGEEVHNLEIPDAVTTIHDYAFSGCSGMTSITVPDSVTSIGDYAFLGCKGLVSVTLPSSITSIGANAFASSGLTSITIPDSVMRIGEGAFSGCPSYQQGNYAAIHQQIYDTRGGVIYVDGWAIGHDGNLSGNLEFNPRGIADCAFSNCGGLISVSIGNRTKSIGDHAFSGCGGITTASIGSGVTSIGNSAFCECSLLSSITISDAVKRIGNAAFYNCRNLSSMAIPYNTTSIGHHAFYNCYRLASVTIPNSVTNIGESAFNLCSGLKSVYTSDLVAWCGISFGNSLANPLYYANHLFLNGEEVFDLVISDSVTSIGNYVFGGCSGIKSIMIPSSVANIGDGAFADCNGLTSITIPSSVTNIGDGAFAYCSGLTSMTIPASVTRIGNEMFTHCEQLETITLPDTVTSIGSHAFSGCENLTFVMIPRCVTGVGDAVFTSCTNLETLYISDYFNGRTSNLCLPERCKVVFYPLYPQEICLEGSKHVALVPIGDAPWLFVGDQTTTDGYCIRSGEINAGCSSVVETLLAGPGVLSFKWKVPAGRGDYARVYLDGKEQFAINRKTEWQPALINIPAGEHIVRWIYERGSGSATGEDAAFLDDVDWRPQVSLAVSSAFVAASPAAGAHTLVYGDEVAASVATPEPADGTRRVCTGWTGTGSVPAMGIGTNVSFRIEEDSTLSWNWRTDHWIGLLVSGGTADFEPQWVEAGTEVVAEIVPATHLYAVALAGDTNGVTLAGTTLTIPVDGPREIAVTVEEAKLVFAVESEWGEPSPTNGVYALSWGTEIEASVAEPEPTDGVRYVCAGWTGTGSVPAGGDGTNVSFRIEEDSTLAWNWRTNVWIALAASGPVSVNFAEAWTNLGETVVAGWTPSVPYFTVALSDGADGVTLDEAARTVSIPADRPRSVALSVTELTLAEALDAPGLVWTTDGDAGWFPQVATSADGEDAARSGNVPVNGTSALQTVLEGPGTFAWMWRIDAAGNFGVDVFLDGTWQSTYAPEANWSDETLAIVDEGSHVIRFEFWNAGTEATAGDCAYLDQVSWTGEVPGGRKIDVNGVGIPFAWIATNAPAALAAADDDYETAAKAMAANGANKVWECYVAGLDPTNATSRFFAEIDATVDPPRVTWTPDLNEGGTKNERVYTVEGKTNLVDQSWGPTNEATRFFRVKVQMPE